MKKTTLITMTVLMALLVGCGGTDDEETPPPVGNPSSITTEFQTFYIKVLDQSRTGAPDISTGARWHLHNNVNNGDTIGLAIQKVFVNDSPSEAGALVLYDFSEATDFTSASRGTFDAGTMSAGEVANGAWVVNRTDSEYAYLGNLASGAEANGKAYWGFVIKSVSATAKADNVNLELVSESGSLANSSIAGWFGIKAFGAYADENPDPPEPPEPPAPPTPVLTSDFATYYLDIAAMGFDGVEGLHFHNKTDHEIGMVVERIFATNTKGQEEAVVFEFDGTDKSVEEDAANGSYYGWSTISGTEGTAAIGIAEGTGNYAYIGGFGTPLFANKAYIGIVAKNVSGDVKGDEITVQPVINGTVDDSKSKTFAELFVPYDAEGTEPTPPEPPEPPALPESVLTSEFATYYLDIAATEFTGVEGLHFHNKTDHEIGMVVERIFATNTPGLVETIIQEFDGTDKSKDEDAENGSYYWSNFSGIEGTATIGVAAGTDNYAYIGGFGTPLFEGKAYIGIVAKNVSDAVKGDEITVQPVISGTVDDSKSKTFAELFASDVPAEFSVYYLDIAATEFTGVEGLHFHNKTDHEVGLVVDRIFATNTKGLVEAVIQEFDGTDKQRTDDVPNGSYYWSDFSGTEGTATIGIAAGTDNYAYIGGFATPLFVDKAYIGIVAKNVSDTVKGDEITVQPVISGTVDDSKSKTFAELFSK